MSLLVVACRTGAGRFRELLWEPLGLVAQLAHAAQVQEGAQMRWVAAEEQDVLNTLNVISGLCDQSI